MTSKIVHASTVTVNTDSYTWSDPYGGTWGTDSNWIDLNNGTVVNPPGATNAVTIGGGAGLFTVIEGTGAAAQLSVSQEVLLWGGTVAVAGAITVANPSTVATVDTVTSPDFELDGGATLSAAALNLVPGATLEVGGGSTLAVSGLATLNDGYIAATSGSVVRLGSLIANGDASPWYSGFGNTLAVDDNSSLEVGTTGAAALGAVTIDKSASAAVTGSIDGNLVVNGTLGVQAGGTLAVDDAFGGFDPFGSAGTISGTGTLVLSQNSHLYLGVVDSAAIQFGGPGGVLVLDAIPSGTITGFGSGDIMETGSATGVTYKQTSASLATLTLTEGGKAVGALKLAGNYTGDLFHLSVNSAGVASITLQTVGSAPVQPAVILGTSGSDTLTATANNQTLTGLGGGDTLRDGRFNGIDFKDTSADLNGSTISAFGLSDVIDLTDVNAASASVNFTPGSTLTSPTYSVTPALLTVTDGTRTAAIDFAVTGTFPAGYFSTASDGNTGTDVKYVAVNTDSYTFSSALGGVFGTASNWRDTSIGATATLAPSYGNNLTIAGGTAAYADINGNGVGASLTTSSDVLLLGTVTLGGKVTGVSGVLAQSGTLALAGGANLSLTGQAAVGGEVEIGGGSKLTAGGALKITGSGSSVLAFGGSSARFTSVNESSAPFFSPAYIPPVIGVDATSSIEFGTAGTVAAGALTIDNGVTADLFGTISGNVVVNGTLAVAGPFLAVGSFGTVLPAVTGTGTIDLFSGETLSLAGSDSAAILFNNGYNSSVGGAGPESLALGVNLPTGTISGFAAGDAISVAEALTGVTYAPSGSGGILTLLNGSTKLGTLSLAGSYSASQFQVGLAAGGQSSTILLAAMPSVAGGTAVSSNSDAYTWNNTSGGVWGNAGNWTDQTTGKLATTAPGAGNAVTIADSETAYGAEQIISGAGTAASLSVSAPTILTANLTIAGQLTVNAYSSGGSYTGLAGGAALTVSGLTVYSAFQVAGGSSLTETGSAYTSINANFSVIGGSAVSLTGTPSTSIYEGVVSIDGTSRFEIGSAGTAAAGSLTIDSGHSLSVGSAMSTDSRPAIDGNLVVNGTLTVAAGLIQGFAGTVGTIAGTGTINVGSGQSLTGAFGRVVLGAYDSAAIMFSNGYNYLTTAPVQVGSTVLELEGSLPAGTISGFVSGDAIQVDKTVTGVSFKQTTATQGTLTLTNGSITVGTLTLAGSFAGELFHLDVAAATGYATVSVQTAAAAAGTGAANAGKDAYSWTGASGGVWSTAANWMDTTTAKMPTTVAGIGDAVTIAGSTTGNQTATTVGGNGAAASLTVSGDVLQTGTVAVGGLVSLVSAAATGELDLDSNAKLTAGSAAITGTLQAGGGSSATISGTATLSGGTVTILNGSTVQAGGLVANNGNDSIAVDSSSVFKIGAPATAAAGAITEAAGATAALSGSIYGNLVAAGTISVAGGGSLFIDLVGSVFSDLYSTAPAITGAGLLSITEGSTLGLGAADSTAIQFAGPNGTLALAKLPTGTISGFTAGDQIEIEQEVTGLSYSGGTLTLTNGSATVGTLALSGSYAANAFHLDAAANGGTAVITLQTLGVAATQPTLIQGTAAADQLAATATGQTLTGGGGGDTLLGGGLAGLDFKDLTANLNGSSIEGFATTDIIDFTDLKLASATQSYAAGSLTVGDGTHAATLSVGFSSHPATGSFHLTSDGGAGTKLSWS